MRPAGRLGDASTSQAVPRHHDLGGAGRRAILGQLYIPDVTSLHEQEERAISHGYPRSYNSYGCIQHE